MKIVTLKRTHSLPTGMYGTLDIENEPFCQTLELPWKDNKEDVSCIPAGEYLCKRGPSPARGYEVYWLQNVPNRKNVQIHIGNTIMDVLGCILLGRSFGPVETKTAGTLLGVQESGSIFKRFMETLKNDPEFKLIIT